MQIDTIMIGLFASAVASFIGSFSGGGASLILFPLLLLVSSGSYIAHLAIVKISATTMTFLSGGIHKNRYKIDKLLVLTLIVTGLIGTAVGTYLVQFQYNENVFKWLLTLTLAVAAIYLIFEKNLGHSNKDAVHFKGKYVWLTIIFSVLINILNGLFGGTALFVTFFLVSVLKKQFIESIAYAFISYAVINIIQTTYLISATSINFTLALSVLVGSIIGTWTGTNLQYIKGNKWVKFSAVSMMLLISFTTVYSIY